VGLAKSRLLADDLATTRVISRRARRGAVAQVQAAAALADAAERQEKGFVPEAARSPERVFLPGRKDPVVLRQNSAELFLLTRLRDEAHRFAITFHRRLRRGRMLQSVLESIPGIGDGRRRALLRHFGSLKKVREASAEALAEVEGLGSRQAKVVFDFFHPAGAAADAAGGGAEEAGSDEAAVGAGGESSGPTEADIDAALAEEGDAPEPS